jgi:hypothetical protein
VVTAPATVEKDVQVILKVNNTQICPIGNATSAGAFSCNYQVETAGLYQWNATVEGEVGGENMMGTLTSGTFTFTAGPYVQQIPLVQGWNLISLPLVPGSTAIANVLASQIAGGNFTSIFAYQGGSWKSALLSSTHVVSGTLTTIQDGVGYWIFMTRADNLFVVGSIIPAAATPPSYALPVGWNLIGFKPQPTIGAETVTVYLGSLGSTYDTNNVWIYDNVAGSWTRATGSTTILPGQGIWVYMNSAAVLYP